MKYSSPQIVEHLASAYVPGTLEGGARRRFERLARDRADVRLAVTRWEARLGTLAGPVPPVKPSPRVWEAIAARTRPAAQADRAASRWPAWLRPAGFGLGGVAAGVIACAAVMLGAPALFFTSDQIAMRSGERLPSSYVGLLTDAQGNGKLLVSSLRHGRTMTVKVIGPITPPSQGRLVLWAVPADGPAFVLGDVPARGTGVSTMPDTSEKLLAKVGKLLVTQETSAAPTAPGTVIYSGNCAKLW
ncbi:MAG: anti-sigma factor [Burkholderiales bacterium]|nr:anti-sigma factor [Burkholderiales bacterium]